MEQEGSSARPIAAPGGVVYRVAYGQNNDPIPAVLSVAMVRLGNPSVFQDRLNRPLWHLSTREFVLNVRSLPQYGRCAKPRCAGVVYRIGIPSTKSSDRPLWHLSVLSRTIT